MIQFKNTYDKLPENFFEKVLPEKFPDPSLIIFNKNLAKDLKINLDGLETKKIADIFSGQRILNGSSPLAMAYAGFQFGHPVPQLGDGRAHLLGEVEGHDLQLKGSGRTKFSRRGDGRSALGPVLREYIVSEAMNHLGVPTTRALCAVTTGESVYRQDGPEPGGILTRVADSHLRVGTFQYFAFQNDTDSIKTLLDYTILRHYPELADLDSYSEKSLAILSKLMEKQSDLIAKWSSLGFIHGVMNTDNFSVAGITIDYGPCAFMDEFKFEKVFSSIDQHGRYSFFNQVPIAKWNLCRLAECLIPLIEPDEDKAIRIIDEQVINQFEIFDQKRMIAFSKKLGIKDYRGEDDKIILKFLKYLESESLDFTLAFRNLPSLFNGDTSFYPQGKLLDDFVLEWKKRVEKVDHLDSINPIYIPRNHQVQKVIDEAYNGSFDAFHKLIEVTSSPFDEQTKYHEYSLAPKPRERVYQTFCGT